MRPFLFLLFTFNLFANFALLQKANKYFVQGKFTLAETYYQKYLKQNPEDFIANYNIGKIYYFKQEYDKAIKYLSIALEIKPEPKIKFLLANSYIEKGDIDRGISMLSNIIKKNSKFAEVYLNLGLVSLKYKNDKDTTINCWEKFLTLKPDDPQAPAIKKALEYLKQKKELTSEEKESVVTSLTQTVQPQPEKEPVTPSETPSHTPSSYKKKKTRVFYIPARLYRQKPVVKFKIKERKSITTE